jgi:hypothetical protein
VGDTARARAVAHDGVRRGQPEFERTVDRLSRWTKEPADARP